MNTNIHLVTDKAFQKVYDIGTGVYSSEAWDLLGDFLRILDKRYNLLLEDDEIYGLVRLYENGELYLRVDRRGYENVKKFDVQEYMTDFQKICKEICSSPEKFIKDLKDWLDDPDKTKVEMMPATEFAKAALLLSSIFDGKPLKKYVGRPWNAIKAQKVAFFYNEVLDEYKANTWLGQFSEKMDKFIEAVKGE